MRTGLLKGYAMKPVIQPPHILISGGQSGPPNLQILWVGRGGWLGSISPVIAFTVWRMEIENMGWWKVMVGTGVLCSCEANVALVCPRIFFPG